MSQLLYYPTISILDSSWLPKALLYWDGIATIAPLDYLRNPYQFSPFTCVLLREELLKIEMPEQYSYSHQDDYEAFFDWVFRNADSFSLDSCEKNNVSTMPFDLHVGKLGYVFGEKLVEEKLGQRVGGGWIRVDRKLGEAFMTFLALLIGQTTDRDPVTDSALSVSSLFYLDRRTASLQKNAVRSRLRNSILDEILPVPAGLHGVEGLRKVRQFKERYNDELERFRRRIEDFILSVDGQPEAVQEERRRIFLKDAQEEIDEIKGHMGWFRAPQINMGTFIAVLPSALSMMSGESTPAAAAAGVAGVIGETMYNRDRTVNRKKPLAYAALYQRQLGRRFIKHE